MKNFLQNLKFADDYNRLGPAYVISNEAASNLEAAGNIDDAKKIRQILALNTLKGGAYASIASMLPYAVPADFSWPAFWMTLGSGAAGALAIKAGADAQRKKRELAEINKEYNGGKINYLNYFQHE